MRTPLLRPGDRGEAVRDLRSRLHANGLSVPAGDVYDEATEQATREFQRQRRLRVDGICGPETWGALIESGFRLGDRLLYLAGDMLRGDDVAELQRRLNSLGFDAGREDGILGAETHAALCAFQRNAGVSADGICGPATLRALDQVGGLAAGSVATVRERERLLRDAPRLDGLRVYLVGDPGLAPLASTAARLLGRMGAVVGLDTSGDDPSLLAREANRFRAGVFVALAVTVDAGVRCAYFANASFRSEGGLCVAQRLTDALRTVFDEVDEPVGRTYRLLRETRMAAVVCELAAADDVTATADVATRLPEIANALVEGIRLGVEEPLQP